jgi:hypothetical protein
MSQVLLNNTSTKLVAAVAPGDTTINVTAGDGALFALATGGNTIRATLVKISGFKEIAWEIVDVTARSTDALTVTRARESTSALSFAIGDLVDVRFTAGADLSAMGFATVAQTHGKNLLVNPGFTVNQRGYVSAATLAAGSLGHDRWIAGAGGGDYSFTQLASNTTITIAANKTLIQIVEDKLVQGATYTLSWTGTAKARYAVNSATPAGSYVASPITITGQTPGTVMSVEFGNGASAGTLVNAQLELGASATSFDYRSPGPELALCQRDAELCGAGGTGRAISATVIQGPIIFKVTKRVVPTVTLFAQGVIVELGVATRTGSGGTLTVNTAPTVNGGGYYDLSGFSSMTSPNMVLVGNDCLLAATGR